MRQLARFCAPPAAIICRRYRAIGSYQIARREYAIFAAAQAALVIEKVLGYVVPQTKVCASSLGRRVSVWKIEEMPNLILRDGPLAGTPQALGVQHSASVTLPQSGLTGGQGLTNTGRPVEKGEMDYE